MKAFVLAVFLSVTSLCATAQFTKAQLQATGLTCAMCSNAINKAVGELPFVADVKSDIKNSSFQISFKENADVEIDAIRQAVEDAGFSVGKLQLTGSFDNLEVNNDDHVSIGKTAFHFVGIKDQSLQGEQTLTVVEKNFLTAKQFKKYGQVSKLVCVKTGKAETCCMEDGIPAQSRVYHVTI